jgi:PhzF family phenazine biosynthesis protein
MGVPIAIVDAFTAEPFKGNPAAVCLLPGPRDEVWMQNVAREMNLSETAFLQRMHGERGGYVLRWFTPAVEVDLCGHATLASAHALWEQGELDPGESARFHTRSGVLTARRDGEWIELDFPAHSHQPSPPIKGLARALGVSPLYVARTGANDVLVEVDSEATVSGVQPDLSFVATLPHRGVVVTSRSASPDYDFVSRFFAPRVGVPEDPVCGSAHCCLATFWGERLQKEELKARQLSARGGVLRLQRRGNRVLLGGQAVTVMRGELT